MVNQPPPQDVVSPEEFRPLELELKDGRQVTVREVRADDGERMQAALRAMSAESRHTRFMSAVRELTPNMLDRAIHPVAGREFQLVAVAGQGAQQEIVGG